MREPTILDLRGLKCPLPVLRTRKALRRLPPGGEIVVLSTDPLADLDIPHMAAEDGHAMVKQWREGDAVAFHLCKRVEVDECGASALHAPTAGDVPS